MNDEDKLRHQHCLSLIDEIRNEIHKEQYTAAMYSADALHLILVTLQRTNRASSTSAS